jgi:hypothetical protein
MVGFVDQSKNRLIFHPLRPTPWASYQCSSADLVDPVGVRIVAVPFIFRQFLPPYRFIKTFNRRMDRSLAMTATSVSSPTMVNPSRVQSSTSASWAITLKGDYCEAETMDFLKMEWVKVITDPLGFSGFALAVVVYLASTSVQKRNSDTRWPQVLALTLAGICIDGGLAGGGSEACDVITS